MNFDSSVLNVPIEDIIPNRFQPRLVFNDDSLQELAASIKQHGIIQPLVLRPNGEKYEIIAGERRYKAAKMAGLASVPAVISKADIKTSAEAAVAENVARKQLSAIEEARSYKALLEQGYMNQEELANRMGVSENIILSKLRLLNLTDEVQTAVLENKISERHARSLLRIKDRLEQIEWLNRIINERLTVRQLDELLDEKYFDIPDENLSININVKNNDNNKYFADEAVNMQLNETSNEINMNNPDIFTINANNSVNDNIEMLDIVPDNNNYLPYTKQLDNALNNISQNMNIIVNKTENDLTVNYNITFNKEK